MCARLHCAVLFNALHENKHVYKTSGISAVTLVTHHQQSFRAENGTALKTESINTLSPNKPHTIQRGAGVELRVGNVELMEY